MQNVIAITNKNKSCAKLKTDSEVLKLCREIALLYPEYIAVLDSNYCYININDNYKILFGKKYETFIGKSISKTFGTGIFNKLIKPKLSKSLEENRTEKFHIDYKDGGDKTIFLEVVCVPYINVSNFNKTRIFMYFKDITYYKSTRTELQIESRVLKSVVATIPNLITICDLYGKYVFVNESTAEIYGVNADVMIGKCDAELDYQLRKTKSSIEIGTQLIEKKQKRIILEETVTNKNGQELWLQTIKQTFSDPVTDETYILSISTDITQYHSAKEELKQSEKRFRDFAETAANIFWELDKDLNYTYLSGNIQILFGEIATYPLGKSFDSLYIENPNCEIDLDSYRFMLETRADILNYTFSIKNNSKELYIFRINAIPIFNHKKQFEGYRGVIRNVTEERILLERIAYEATHDALTGLVNRNEFDRHLKNVVKNSHDKNEESVICYLDLDHFKVVNDSAGHQAGDALLKQLGDILKDKVRASDMVARLGGDEFGIILEHCPLNNALRVCDSILRGINQFVFEWNGKSFKIGVSIGVAMITNKSLNETVVLSQADMACYRSKELGRNQWHVAHTDDTAISEMSSEFAYVSAITDALDNDRLFLMRQPIISLTTSSAEVPHYELLARILDVKDNIIPPNDFVKVAERYGMICGVDRYVIKKAFHYYRQELLNSNIIISINLSGNTISDPQILEFIKSELDKSGISPSCVCFEITETAAISSISKARNVINELKAFGVKFALDDFGSGLSSFGYLKDLPVDYLKIDGTFVKNMVDNEQDRAIVRSINEVAKIMNMQTIAEFVENDAIINSLREIGVDYAQGFGVGRPERIS